MKSPVQITYRNMEPSDALTTRIREDAEKLDEFFPRIVSCRVVVEAPHQHQKQSEHFHVRIELGVPGDELIVSHEPTPHATLSHDEDAALLKHVELHPEHKDVYVAIRDAFVIARRRLQHYAECLRGDVKSHVRPEDTAAP